MFQISYYYQSDNVHRKHCLCCLEETPIIMTTYWNETIYSSAGFFCHCQHCYWLFLIKTNIVVLCHLNFSGLVSGAHRDQQGQRVEGDHLGIRALWGTMLNPPEAVKKASTTARDWTHKHSTCFILSFGRRYAALVAFLTNITQPPRTFSPPLLSFRTMLYCGVVYFICLVCGSDLSKMYLLWTIKSV